ncbi:MAG: hypothetical protein OIF32_10745 [Campylobacterales bacterium]|nr:hypothetical protein [Campylobacterales bacterium]
MPFSPELKNELLKIKYHIRLLNKSIDREEYPLEALIVDMNWTENQFKACNKIFQKYDALVTKNGEVNSENFEFELKDQFDISKEKIRMVVNAFYKKDMWVGICFRYAEENQHPDFDDIFGI